MLSFKGLQKFIHLSTAQKLLLIKGISTYLCYSVLLQFLPNKVLLKLIKLPWPSPRFFSCSAQQVQEVFDALSWRLPGMSNRCLCRAFVAYVLFRAAGLKVHFCYGVDIDSELLLAHSWVEDDEGKNLSDVNIAPRTFKQIMKI